MIQTQHKGKASKPTLFILNNISFVFSFLMIIGMKFKAKRRRVEKYFVYNFHWRLFWCECNNFFFYNESITIKIYLRITESRM